MNRKGLFQKVLHQTKQSTVVRFLSGISIVEIALVFTMLIWNGSAGHRFEKVVTMKGNLMAQAERFEDTSAYLTQEARAYAVTRHKEHYDNYHLEVNTTKNREMALENMHLIGITDEEDAMIKEMEMLSNSLVPLERKAMLVADNGHTQEAISLLYNDKYENSINKISDIAKKFNKTIEDRMQEKLDYSGNIIDFSFYATFICLVVVAANLMAVILYVRKIIIAPILSIKENMLDIAQGNLDTIIKVESDQTEIGQLAFAIKDIKKRTSIIIEDIDYIMANFADGDFTVESTNIDNYIGAYLPILNSLKTLKEKQNDTLYQIDVAATQVSAGANHVADGAQALASGATEQASSIEELSATIADVSNQISQTAEYSQHANTLGKHAGEVVKKSQIEMRQMMKAINDIALASENIKTIIKEIDEIAFQTNILALNAAVEAARAGNAGKGFAVVADEVRRLAQKSAEAAKDTTELIENSLLYVSNGQKLATSTDTTFEQVAKYAEDMFEMVEKIAQVSNEQALSISQISQGIDQISAIVQTNSATSQEGAATSEELSGHADVMKSLINQFKLSHIMQSV